MQLMGKRIKHDIVVLEHLQDNIIKIDCINKHFLGYSEYKQSPVWETPPIDSGKPQHVRESILGCLIFKNCQNQMQERIWQSFWTKHNNDRHDLNTSHSHHWTTRSHQSEQRGFSSHNLAKLWPVLNLDLKRYSDWLRR